MAFLEKELCRIPNFLLFLSKNFFLEFVNIIRTFQNDAEKVVQVIKSNHESEPISPNLAATLKNLWEDQGVQAAYERRHDFHLHESAK